MPGYSFRMARISRLLVLAGAAAALWVGAALAQDVPATAPPSVGASQLVHLGVGDQVRIDVFGNAELATTTSVTADGTVRVPLAGPVHVVDLSPTDAATAIEAAFRDGGFLVDPHVTVTVIQSSSQRVSVVGEVRRPGRYPIESTTTVLDLIALAGGTTEKGSDVVYILRPTDSGVTKLQVDTHGLMTGGAASELPTEMPRGGDSIVVPRNTYFINGQVAQPGEFRIDGETLLYQAIARAGGVTPLGSASRVVIRRRGPDGKLIDVKGKEETPILPGDVITVKERLF
jgi:polysaccharide export outer membrane protein